MGISVGTSVLVTKLKKHGTVLEDLGGGSYKVQIGALSMRVDETDLTVSAQSTKKPLRDSVAPEGITISSDASQKWRSLRSLDLHGMTVSEALRILEEHLSRAVMANVSEVEVMHGLGTGKLKDSILEHLKTMPVVKGVSPHPFNRGITRVFI
ncbi:MAG: hypothetical protein EBZ48_14660 [Proteobacteria bacterium]|nr:hypothetical protein [Pseudomonadota bacterium]